MQVIYDNLCMACGGPMTNDMLDRSPVCNKCDKSSWLEVYRSFNEELWELISLFKKLVGSDPWSIQKVWMKRLLWNESFAIIAPTGVGKTTLLQVYSIYAALRNKRCYFILPTSTLVEQVYNTLTKWIRQHSLDINIIGYSSHMRNREKILNDIMQGNYQILVSTSAFLSRYYGLLMNNKFNLIIVDDVDSVLRNSKNIDRILMLLGFEEHIIKSALKLLVKKIELYKAKLIDNKQMFLKLIQEIVDIERKIHSEIKEKDIGQLVISSATGRGRGLRVKLFKELLGFSVGGSSDYMRNIIDTYKIMNNPITDVVDLVNKLGPGGLIFISRDINKMELITKLITKLNTHGIKAAYVRSGQKFLDKLQRGEVDVLIGAASYYGVMCRGIDEPRRIKYAIFIGIPKFSFNIEKALNNPRHLAKALTYLKDQGEAKAKECIKELRKYLFKLRPLEWMIIKGILNGKIDVKDVSEKYKNIADELNEIKRFVLNKLNEYLSSTNVIKTHSMVLVKRDKRILMLIPDVATYIQASGRTSRLYQGNMTLGLSLILVDVPELLEVFKNKIQSLIHGFNLIPLESIDLYVVGKKLKESRKTRKEKAQVVNIKTALLVVESPTKAKSIARMLGRPSKRRLGRMIIYEVPARIGRNVYVLSITATRGHLFDLTTRDVGIYGVIIENNDVIPIYSTIRRCLHCKSQFTENITKCPRCGSTLISDSIDIVRGLQKLAQEVDEVFIATDPDIEGEKIAWDIANIIRPFNKNIRRIEMHEITLHEVMKALRNPKDINNKLVAAQIIRRIDDRWIGFGLSKLLQIKLGLRWLGAGRVQTPVLGWIINRYNEWKNKKVYKITIYIDKIRKLALHVKNKNEAEEITELIHEKGLVVEDIKYGVDTLSPKPPFTTDALIYEASKKLGFTASKVMKLAQDLFEAGLITYHRTDSIFTSTKGISIAREYLRSKGIEQYFTARHWSKPGAHECIRPTKPLDRDQIENMVIEGSLPIVVPLTNAHLKLYDLIFKRFIASQMGESKILKANLTFSIGGKIELNIDVPIKIITHGFDLVEPVTIWDNVRNLHEGDVIKPRKVLTKKTSLVLLYDHGSIVAEMRNKGIGRPSTYSKIIEKLLGHGYIVESKKKKFLIPTKLGITVFNYLMDNFRDLVSEVKTRSLEQLMDLVGEGKVSYHEALDVIKQDLDVIRREITKSYPEITAKMYA